MLRVRLTAYFPNRSRFLLLPGYRSDWQDKYGKVTNSVDSVHGCGLIHGRMGRWTNSAEEEIAWAIDCSGVASDV